MTTQQVTGRCEICNEQFSGPTQAQLNRNLGLHRRKAHGIKSAKAAASLRYRANRMLRLNGALDARATQLAKARKVRWTKYYAAKAKTPAVAQQTEGGTMPLAAEPARLSECPLCRARFYAVRSGEQGV